MDNRINKIEKIVGRPILYVDFNEGIEDNLYLLSREDYKKDINNQKIMLEEGLRIVVYMDDFDKDMNRDDLFALGIVRKQTLQELSHVKWCVEIEGNEIRHVGEFTF